MNHLLRNALSLLAILALLASSIGMSSLQYSNPDSGANTVLQGNDTSPVSAVDMNGDPDAAKHADCNHGCHACNHLLMHLNSFPAILAVAPLMAPVSGLLVTPVLFLLAESFFKPPR